MRQMQEFSAKAYGEFQRVEAEIDRNRQNVEDILTNQFQNMESALASKQAKEIQQAVKDGKDEQKIKECLAKEEQELRRELEEDIQRTRSCLYDATNRAKKVVREARNAFTETSVASAMQGKDWAQRTRFCLEKGDGFCVREGVSRIEEMTKYTMQEGSRQMARLEEAPRRQTIQMTYCSENFVQDMQEMRDLYSKAMKRCVIASEIQTPEPEDEEEEEKKVEVNVDAEVTAA